MAKVIVVGFSGKTRMVHGLFDTGKETVKEWAKSHADVISGDVGVLMSPTGKLLADYKRIPSRWGPQFKWWY